MERRRNWALTAATLAVLGAGGALSACDSDDAPSAAPSAVPSASASPGRVLLPGRPGEPATESNSDQYRAPDDTAYNSIDVAYIQMMIAHHQQAVLMADLAPERAANPGVRNLASRISAAQGAELNLLKSWLRDRNQPEMDPAHDHATMPGMQSEDAISALTAAKGTDFDQRFITMMTAHHQGAQQMTADVLRGGVDQRVSEMANETAVEQIAEIQRMAQLDVS